MTLEQSVDGHHGWGTKELQWHISHTQVLIHGNCIFLYVNKIIIENIKSSVLIVDAAADVEFSSLLSCFSVWTPKWVKW